MTNDELKAALMAAHEDGNEEAAMQIASLIKVEPQTTAGDKLSSIGKSFSAGVTDPFFGASELIYKGGSWAADKLGAGDTTVGKWLKGGVSDTDSYLKSREYGVQQARKDAGFEGVDLSRVGGNIASPVNMLPGMAVANKYGMATSALGRAAQGGLLGATAGLTTPVGESDSYALDKIGQVGLGAAAGGIMSPIVGAASTGLSNLGARIKTRLTADAPDEMLLKSFADAGLKAEDFSASQLDAFKQAARSATKKGKLLDPAALARQADADALGIKLTSGQATRDPAQYAFEKNTRNIDGVGSPLMARFTEQDRALNSLLTKRAEGALDPVDAGRGVIADVADLDQQMGKRVNSLYEAARNSSGATADVPSTGLASDLGKIASNFEGDVPDGLLNRFKDFGFLGGKQTRILDMVEAEKLLKATNDYGDVTNKASGKAIGEIRAALKRAITEGAEDGGPFALPRMAAAKRFQMQDSIKALNDVSNGDVTPDTFIDKYIVKGTHDDVKGLAGILTKESRDEVKRQIGVVLNRAAYRDDVVGDAPFLAKPYNAELRKIGRGKLEAFFGKDETDELFRVGRVAATIKQIPENSAVNHSNTTSALYNLSRATGSGLFKAPLLSMIPQVADDYAKRKGVSYALSGRVAPVSPLLEAATRRNIGILTLGSGTGAGMLASE